MKIKHHISLAIACFFWATSFIATKMALESMGVMTLAGARHVVACACFVGWFVCSSKQKFAWPHWDAKLLFNLFILSLLAVSVHHVAQISGLKFTTAANASVYSATGPVMIFLIAAVILKEGLSRRKVVGIVFALAGVVLVTGVDTFLSFKLSGRLYGDFLVAFSIFTWACFTVFSKKTATRLDPLQLTAAISILGTLTILPFTLWEHNISGQTLAHITLRSWGAAAFLGVTSSFIANLLYIFTLKEVESQKVGIYLYSIPPMTAFMAALYLGEVITPSLIIGTLLVFCGLAIAQRG